MYEMIIVEDEEIERGYLLRFVDWKSMGINITAAFESGEEALEYAQKAEIDILLTDIKLIGISGLHLAKKLLEIKPKLKVIILSGYQDFEYAKEAVELQAFSYLTKPVDLDELADVFQKVVAKCSNEENERLEKARLYAMVEQNMPVLKSKFFDDLIHGRLSEQEINGRLQYFGLDLVAGCYNVLLCEIDAFENMITGLEPSEIHLNIIKVLDCIKSVDFNQKSETFHLEDGRYCTILAMDSDSVDSLYECSIILAQKLQERLNTYLNLEVTIGVGKDTRTLNELKTSYKKACDAVAFKFYMGSNQIIHYKDVYYDESSSIIDLDETGKQIVTAIGLCDRNNLEAGLARLFDDIKNSSCTDIYIRNLCIGLVAKVSVMLQDMHESIGKVFGNETMVWDKLLKLDTIFDLQLWMKNIFNAVIDYLVERKNGCNKKIINDILRFIDDNYHKNIGITDISKQVYLSPNYISIIFKKVIGEAFTNFLIKYRMEKAVQMFKETNLKVYEVGDRVGYPNASHFCSAFKKIFGVSPNEFRDKI